MKAFTLIELLVSITIIGLLLSLGIPSLINMSNEGKKVKEIAALKSLIVAYNSYAADNNNSLIKSYDKDGKAYDINGNSIGGGVESHEAARWPWRLAPYFNYNFYNTTHVNKSGEYIKSQGGLSQTYLVSVIPSFGLNVYLGGNDYESIPNHLIASNLNQVSKPSQTIAFVSSRSMAAGQRFEGFYYVTLPRHKGKYDSKSNPKSTGYISARYNSSAVAAFVGGNVQVISYSNISNTNYWYPTSQP